MALWKSARLRTHPGSSRALWQAPGSCGKLCGGFVEVVRKHNSLTRSYIYIYIYILVYKKYAHIDVPPSLSHSISLFKFTYIYIYTERKRDVHFSLMHLFVSLYSGIYICTYLYIYTPKEMYIIRYIPLAAQQPVVSQPLASLIVQT